MVHAFCETNIKVKKNEDGKLTFRLEKLAEANSFDSSNSHDAIADVDNNAAVRTLKKNEEFFLHLKIIQFLKMLKKN